MKYHYTLHLSGCIFQPLPKLLKTSTTSITMKRLLPFLPVYLAGAFKSSTGVRVRNSSQFRIGAVKTAISALPTASERDRQAIDGVKAAISSPKTPSFPLIECEFPPLQALNKLGDGSLRSAAEVDKVRRNREADSRKGARRTVFRADFFSSVASHP